jgi:rhodanese-related sulfurtransferase
MDEQERMHQELTATELTAVLGTDDEPLLLDVRDPEEVAAWSIPGALNIPSVSSPPA